MEYLKDNLNREKTAYDKLTDDDLDSGPRTPIREIQKIFKELQKKYYTGEDYDKLEELSEARRCVSSTGERLKIDIFYFCLPEESIIKRDDTDEK